MYLSLNSGNSGHCSKSCELTVDQGHMLEDLIRTIVEQHGGFMKIADLSDVNVALRLKHQVYFEQFTRGIAIGIPLIRSMVNMLAYYEDPGMIYAFENHCLAQISQYLENISLRIGLLLQEHGYKSFVMFARGRPYKKPPHVLVANTAIGWLSGMGYIGKNGLLIHEKYGPRFRLNVVLTDAPLEFVDEPIKGEGLCINCSACVQSCPSHAIIGERFDPENPRKKFINTERCDVYRNKRVFELESRMCNLCQFICPAGII